MLMVDKQEEAPKMSAQPTKITLISFSGDTQWNSSGFHMPQQQQHQQLMGTSCTVVKVASAGTQNATSPAMPAHGMVLNVSHCGLNDNDDCFEEVNREVIWSSKSGTSGRQ